MKPIQIREILRTLIAHQVDFIVVGGAAAVLQGAPINTFDLDILYSRADDNVERIVRALLEMKAEFRADLSGRRLVPNASHMASSGHKLLSTQFGQLDVLGTIEESTTYEDALGDSIVVDVGGMTIQVLGLARLIAVKAKAGRPKDMSVLPVLEATLKKLQQR